MNRCLLIEFGKLLGPNMVFQTNMAEQKIFKEICLTKQLAICYKHTNPIGIIIIGRWQYESKIYRASPE